MADLYGVENTKVFRGVYEASEAAKSHGRERVILDTYTSSGAEQVNDKAFFGGMKLPKGAELLGYILDHDAMNTGVVGRLFASDGTTNTLISPSYSVAVAGIKGSAVSPNQGNLPLSITAASDVYFIFDVIPTSVTAAKDMRLILFWSQE